MFVDDVNVEVEVLVVKLPGNGVSKEVPDDMEEFKEVDVDEDADSVSAAGPLLVQVFEWSSSFRSLVLLSSWVTSFSSVITFSALSWDIFKSCTANALCAYLLCQLQ